MEEVLEQETYSLKTLREEYEESIGFTLEHLLVHLEYSSQVLAENTELPLK